MIVGNKHDSSAIELWISRGIGRKQLSWIPQGTNRRLAQQIDSGHVVTGRIASLTGREGGKKSLGVNFEISVK